MLTLFISLGIVWQQNMEEISYSGSSNSSKKKLPKRLVVFGGLFLVVLILLGSAGYFITRSNSSSSDDSSVLITPEDTKSDVSQTPAPSEEPSVTPEKSTTPSKVPSKTPSKIPSKVPTGGATSKSDVNVSVQNGSGVTGAAKTAADILTAAGFTVASTGNADKSDYTDVTIRVKNSQKSILSSVEDALSKKYTVGDTSTDLPESTSYDVLVIIGQ